MIGLYLLINQRYDLKINPSVHIAKLQIFSILQTKTLNFFTDVIKNYFTLYTKFTSILPITSFKKSSAKITFKKRIK